MIADAVVSCPAARKVVIWESISEWVRAWEGEVAALARTTRGIYLVRETRITNENKDGYQGQRGCHERVGCHILVRLVNVQPCVH